MNDERTQGHRYHALDGVRGVAALSVMLSHAFWTSPQFSDAVQRANTGSADALTYAFTYTPLHIMWLAIESVLLFFVLSGFVVPLPFLAGKRGWLAYYPARLVRLLLPAWAALLIAWGMVSLFYPQAGTSRSWLLNLEIGHDTSIGALNGFLLVTGVPDILPPLWSLQWELIFSLFLPVYVWVGRRVNTLLKASIVAVLCIGAYGAGTFVESTFVQFLPVFLLGTILAVNIDALLAWLTPRRAGVLAVVSALALCAQWYPRGVSDSVFLIGIGQMLAVAGAAGLVIAAIACRPLARALGEWPVFQWLGTRSFSLYLIHFCIIMTAAFITNGENLWVTLAIGVPISLAAAEVFYRLIENPTVMLSRAIRRSISTRRAVAQAPERRVESAQ